METLLTGYSAGIIGLELRHREHHQELTARVAYGESRARRHTMPDAGFEPATSCL